MNCNHTTTQRRPYRVHTPHFGNLLNEFFNTAVGDVVAKAEQKVHTTNPAINVRKYDDKWIMEVALPGYKKEEVHLTIDGDLLKITSAEKEATEDAPNYRLREFNYAGFGKTFRLAETADASKISAQHADGVLTITIPKKEEAIPQPPKTITIQ